VPLHVTFAWNLQDRDARFSGQGVVRSEPPARARLDLFGPRGEGYLTAVLEDEELRIPGGVAASMLPPPAFLWASLGVFREPRHARLELARRDGNGVELGYTGGDERWRFRFDGQRLRHVEWQGPDGGKRTVELTGDAAHGLSARAVYRDWPAFRELTLSLDGVEQVDAFPTDIWSLSGQ
jgi:hypothetical protein